MILPLQCRILRAISENPGLNGRTIASICGYAPTSASSRHVPLLGDLGLIENQCGILTVKAKGKWVITPKGERVLALVEQIERVMAE